MNSTNAPPSTATPSETPRGDTPSPSLPAPSLSAESATPQSPRPRRLSDAYEEFDKLELELKRKIAASKSGRFVPMKAPARPASSPRNDTLVSAGAPAPSK